MQRANVQVNCAERDVGMLGGRGPYRFKNVTAFAQEVKQVAMWTVLNDNPEFTLHTWVKKMIIIIIIITIIIVIIIIIIIIIIIFIIIIIIIIIRD